jgi:thiosulfate/3-mercaptopyruvate sulfurtransferase
MDYVNPDALVSTEWLAAHLTAPDVRIVDASFKMPGVTPTAREDYAARHIPGAVLFDIEEISAETTDLPHMLPPPEKFAARVRRLGLGDGHRIVVYDGGGVMGAARAWWMFRVFGHEDVAVLDGQLAKWLAEGRPVDDAIPTPRERHFTAKVNTMMVRDKGQVRANLASRREQVLDARAQGRFEASVPEPRPGLRGGHIPGSLNLPYDQLIDPAAKTFLPADQLAERFAAAGIERTRPVVTSCGSGVSACVLTLGLHLLGQRDVAVYDGSWSEWGLPGDTPIETGPAARDSTARRG